jgi:predicted transcriptional regulator
MAISDAEAFHSNELTADIVSAFVAHNSLPIASLAALIQSVQAALTQLASEPSSATPPAPPAEIKEPAVSIRKSVTADYLVCLDDGKQLKSLRRHLRSLGMTPEQYRAKWGLPSDYPMIAANYAALRSKLTKQLWDAAAPRKLGRPAKAGI